MTLLAIDQFRAIFGWSPWLFWGWSTGDNGILPTPTGCSTPLRQHSWQDADNGSRDDVLFAIENAENTLRQYLAYSVAPRYAEEVLTYPDAGNQWVRSGWPNVQLSEGYVQALGTQLLTSIGNAAVTYSDLDGDTLKETFTVSIATSETDPTRIKLYFATADRYDGSGVGERWEIRPIRVSISGGVATIKGNAWLLAKPVKYEVVMYVPLDPTVIGNYVTTVDVYVSTTNQSGITQADAQSLLIYETTPPPFGFCCGVNSNAFGGFGADPATLGYALARGNVSNGQQGWVYAGAAVYDAVSAKWSATVTWATCQYPKRVLVRYLAGYPLESNVYSPYYNQMARQYQEIVARLAAAELVRPPLPCETAANRELARWQVDAAQVRGRADELYATTREILNCPLGTKRGEWFAWRAIQNLQVTQGITV